jgi:hypothetical protein
MISYPVDGSTGVGTMSTGGTITYTDSNNANPRATTPYYGGYKVHTFTTSGTFTASSATQPNIFFDSIATSTIFNSYTTTFNHTMGTGPRPYVLLFSGPVGPGSSAIYAGRQMTLLASNIEGGIWGLANPPAGVNSVTYNQTAGPSFNFIAVAVVSYLGVAPGQPDGTGSNHAASGTSISTTFSTTKTYDWLVASTFNSSVSPWAITGMTQRATITGTSCNVVVADSNGITTVGSHTVTATGTNNPNNILAIGLNASAGYSFSPFPSHFNL